VNHHVLYFKLTKQSSTTALLGPLFFDFFCFDFFCFGQDTFVFIDLLDPLGDIVVFADFLTPTVNSDLLPFSEAVPLNNDDFIAEFSLDGKVNAARGISSRPCD